MRILLIIAAIIWAALATAFVAAFVWVVRRREDRDLAETEQPLPRVNRPPVQPWDRVRPPVRWAPHSPGLEVPVDGEAGESDG